MYKDNITTQIVTHTDPCAHRTVSTMSVSTIPTWWGTEMLYRKLETNIRQVLCFWAL